MLLLWVADDGEIWMLARNGTWVVPSRPAQLFCYDAGLVSEREFRRSFGDVPPLPPAAFRS